MIQSTEYPHGITMLDGQYIHEQLVSVYIMRQGNEICIIETGTNISAELILDYLADADLALENVRYIIPTHVHLDHAAGAGKLMTQCPNAQLIIHSYGARHMINPEKLIAGAKAVYGASKFNQLYGEIIPVPAARVIEADIAGFELDFNGRNLHIFNTPGHAKHHFCLWDAHSRSVFSGDSFGISYRNFDNGDDVFIFPTTTPVQFDPTSLHKTIDKIMSFAPKNIYLTHFGGITPTAKVVTALKDTLDAFVDIARAAQNEAERGVIIRAQLKDYLLQSLEKINPAVDMDMAAQWLKNDIELNSQGLLVWLERQES